MSQPAKPPVYLLKYRLVRLLMEPAKPLQKGSAGRVVLESRVSAASEGANTRILTLSVKADPPSEIAASLVPRTEAEIEGQFQVFVDGEQAEQDKALRVFGGGILYALLRGMISAHASLFSGAEPVLPTVNMSSLLGEGNARAAKRKGTGRKK